LNKKTSIKTKIIFVTGLTTTLCIIAVIAFLYISLEKMNNRTMREKFQEKITYHHDSLENVFTEAEIFLDMIVGQVNYHIEGKVIGREEIQNQILNLFDNNENVRQIGLMIEPNAFDGKDDEYFNTKYGSETGKIVYYFLKDEEDNSYYDYTEGELSDSEFEEDYYKVPKMEKRAYLSDVYKHEGYDMVTLSHPIINKYNVFLGIVYVDIYLDSFYEMLSDEEIYKTGYMLLTDSNGILLYTPNKDKLGSINKENDITEKQDDDIFSTTKSDDVNNKRSFKATLPVSTKTVENTFYLSLIAPVNEINEEINVLILVIFVSLISLIAIILLVLNLIVSKSIKPLRNLVDVSDKISVGDFNFNLPKITNDEIGDLYRNFSKMSSILNELITDIKLFSTQHKNGNMEAILDSNKYSGAFKEVAITTGDMAESYALMILDVIQSLDKFSMGNFDVKLNKYEGQKAKLNTCIEQLKNNLINIEEKISCLVVTAANGDLSVRTNAKEYKGQWANIFVQLNNLLDTVNEPIQEALEVLSHVAKGDFSAKMERDYKGDFLKIKDYLNNTILEISSYIFEITHVLNELSNSNLNVSITRNYIGDFSSIKGSINSIVNNLNDLLNNVDVISRKLHSSSNLINLSSNELSCSSSLQARSLEQISNNVDLINNATKNNAKTAVKANSIAIAAKGNADIGNIEMNKMLTSMDSINETTANISKIIDVIESIAFQTNLLALNASVEAARAGQHGKGFSVVAEEVRNLAARSQKSASETGLFIEESVLKVSNGTEIATTTSNSLKVLVDDVTVVSTMISQISEDSLEQSNSIEVLTNELDMISLQVSKTVATSEESLVIAQELLTHSETLEDIVSTYKLR
jgi:methyl-accepting chemotaxis protein